MSILIVSDGIVSVVLVLHFHTCEAADVNVAAEVLASSESLRNSHVHIKGFVSFIVAVGDACLLLGGLGVLELIIDTELVALCEQKMRE